MKQVIINADDFGLTGQINRAVIEAHQKGPLMSASILANGPAFEEAIALVKSNPDLGVGVHLNILRGRPVSPPDKVGSLIDKNGLFFGSPLKLLSKILLKQVSLTEIESEFKAQVVKVKSSGICPTHLDTEKHIHILPSILRIMIRVGMKLRITKMRSLNTSIQFPYFFGYRSIIFPLFRILAVAHNKELMRSSFLMPDRIYGIFESGSMLMSRYTKIFSSLPAGSSEIICHPGYKDSGLNAVAHEMGKFYLNEERDTELNALLRPELKSLAKKLNISLVSYKNLT